MSKRNYAHLNPFKTMVLMIPSDFYRPGDTSHIHTHVRGWRDTSVSMNTLRPSPPFCSDRILTVTPSATAVTTEEKKKGHKLLSEAILRKRTWLHESFTNDS